MTILKLKKYRTNLNLSQEDVAKHLNITQAQYSRLEKGISQANANQILLLSELFKCTPNDLFGIKGAHTVAIDPLFEEYKKFIEKIKK